MLFTYHEGVSPEIAQGVYCIEVGKGISRSNVYFVQTSSAWILIDAASADCCWFIRNTAESLFGIQTRPASILLTHDHPDHAGSVLDLARIWECPVYMHPDELPIATAGDLSTFEKYANPLDRWIVLPLMRAMPRRRVQATLLKSSLKDVARIYDPVTGVPNLPDWECIPTPGHTPGHVAFFRARDRVLITGDAIVTVDLNSFWGFLKWTLRQNKNKVSGPPWYSTWNLQKAKESVTILAKLEPRVLASGHGALITGTRAVQELRAFASRF